jgi:hypothetical protein
MPRTATLVVLSDIHYASAAEKARGNDYELQGIANPLHRLLLKAFRRFIWLRHPLEQNGLLDAFLKRAGDAACVVANGDYSCDTAFVGVIDDAACQSARECLDKLHGRFGPAVRATIGDHELGKFTLVGARGGMRLASYHRAREELGLEPFWKLRLGRYVLMGLTSSLVALPVFEAETMREERPGWECLRQQHLAEIRAAFSGLGSSDRVLLFSHDPTALPFLWHEESVRRRLPQIEQTIIGHLHSNLVLWKSRVLAGMPAIGFLGHPARRMSTALREARYWKPFRVRLCPSLAGIELLKDGGYYTAKLDLDGGDPARFHFHRIPR